MPIRRFDLAEMGSAGGPDLRPPADWRRGLERGVLSAAAYTVAETGP